MRDKLFGPNFLFRIFYFTPLVGQLATCHIISRWGFTVMTHHMDSMWRPFLRPTSGPSSRAHAAYIQYHLWPISWKAQSLRWITYELLTLWVSPTHRSTHYMVHSAPRAQVILWAESHLAAWVTLYGSSRLTSWGILSSGSLYGYSQFLLNSWLSRSNYVTSHGSYMTLKAHYGLQYFIMAISL